MMNTTFLLSLLLLGGGPVHGIELSLEENRAEHGSIGYVDIKKLFKSFPETVRTKENFEEVVRQAEEQLNVKRVELLRLRNELSQLKIERDFMAKTPMHISSAPAAVPPKPVEPPRKQETRQEPRSPVIGLPGFSQTSSTGPAPGAENLAVNIPGVSTAPIVSAPAPAAPAAPPPPPPQ
ncbi:MAG: OmpH family outer membrane protein, partial [Elusimicrobia bacterium]|nr:OmpH family outer membrane protein [Elusimicrobiota bacterium]